MQQVKEEKYVGKNVSMPISMSEAVEGIVGPGKDFASASAYIRTLISADFKKRKIRQRAKSK